MTLQHSDSHTELLRLQLASAKATRFLRALGNPARLLLLCQLAQGEKNVNELETVTGIRQPTLSQQLAVLREEELVSTRKEGKNVYYQIQSAAALDVMAVLYKHFCAPEALASSGRSA